MAPLSRSASISNLDKRHFAGEQAWSYPTVGESEKILKKWSSNLGASKYIQIPVITILIGGMFTIPINHHSSPLITFNHHESPFITINHH